MDFDSIVKSLTEAIEESADIRKTLEVDGMPAKTYQISDKREKTDELHPKQIAIVQALLDTGKTTKEIAVLLDYPIEKVEEVALQPA